MLIEKQNDFLHTLMYKQVYWNYLPGDTFGSLQILEGEEWTPGYVFAKEESIIAVIPPKKAIEVMKRTIEF